MSSTTGCQGESLERLFQTTPPSLYSMTSLPKMVGALHCTCHRDSLLLRATVVGGNVPYFLSGVEQKKSLRSLRRGVVRREYWGLKSSDIMRNTTRT